MLIIASATILLLLFRWRKTILIIFVPMKFFAFIMGIIVFMVSARPCKDLPLNMKAEKAKMALAKENNQSHQESSDACSPFCSCSCCSTHPCPPPFTNVIGSISEVKTCYTSYYFGLLIAISLPIWQPPQLLS